MRKPLTILGRVARATSAVIKALACALVLGSLTTSVWAETPGSGPTTSSADKTFSALHQALSATATDLLAGAQRPLGPQRVSPGSTLSSDATFGLDVLQEQARSVRGLRLQQAVDRVQALQPAFEPILREEGIPLQMAAVVLVESGGRVTALSPKGARGLWQLMPDTARRYGLVVAASVDERLDLYKATHAAARYLRDLYSEFGDWSLVLAAYNAGEDAVERAIERSSTREFRSIAAKLPLETQNYVPAVLKSVVVLGRTNGRLTTSARNAAVFATASLED